MATPDELVAAKESIYDEQGNLKIPTELVLDKTLTELARKNYEIAQLQVAVELLTKEIQGIQKLVK